MYIQLKTLTLEDGDHEVVLNASDEFFLAHDIEIDCDIIKKRNDKYIVREQETWDSLPIYEIVDGNVMNFNPYDYVYFTKMKRRKALSGKIRKQYNLSAEIKTMRKTLNKILKHIELKDESFDKYNKKVENIIEKIPKNNN